MYLRLTSGAENLPCAYAYIEFTNQPTVPIALQNNGIEFKGRCLRYTWRLMEHCRRCLCFEML